MNIMKIIFLSLMLSPLSAKSEAHINVLGCKLYLPDNYDGNYRSDGSLSIYIDGSSINLSKFDGYLKGGRAGGKDIVVNEEHKYGLKIIHWYEIDRKSGSTKNNVVQISDGVTRLFIIGSMSKNWKEIFKDCGENQKFIRQ